MIVEKIQNADVVNWGIARDKSSPQLVLAFSDEVGNITSELSCSLCQEMPPRGEFVVMTSEQALAVADKIIEKYRKVA